MNIKNFLKDILRLWPLIIVILAGIFLFNGAGFMVAINRLSMFALILLIFHLIRKALFPYIDLKKFSDKAAEEPMSSAIVFTVIIFFIIALCYITVASAATMTNAQILIQAQPLLPTFKNTVQKHWPNAPYQQYFPGTIEQETCIKLTKCWNPHTELKTKREYGFSLSQMTIAYTPTGTVRFNKFEEAKKKYHELAEWKWDDRYNAQYHFTFIVLEMKRLFTIMTPYFHDDVNRWAATLVSYNAGEHSVIDRMVLCQHTKNCNQTQWFNGLDSVALPSESKLLYGKALYLRKNEYPNNIIHIRSDKYIAPWESI